MNTKYYQEPKDANDLIDLLLVTIFLVGLIVV